MIKVLIADDQELIRESLKIVLNTHEDLQVIDTAEDGFGVLECQEWMGYIAQRWLKKPIRMLK